MATPCSCPNQITTPMDTLKSTFSAFADFGSNKALSSPVSTLTNQKFAKLCKDSKVHGDGITNTDTDIIFNKVKGKTERTITFEQFVEAIKLIAAKRYPKKDPNAAFESLCAVIAASGGPKLAGTTVVKNDAILQRMTDTSNYTGASKQRFDESGKGKGKDGRVEKLEGTMTMQSITNRKEADVRGVQK